MKTPKVSVLIPTYNYARFLPEAVESVLTQDFQDFELLICDDASTDNSAEVIKELAGRDSRIEAEIHSTNLGMVRNWNHCLQRARGLYVKFLFGDDKLTRPDALGRMVRLLDDHPHAVMAASGREILDERSRTVDLLQPLRPGCHNGRSIITQCVSESANLVGEPSAGLLRRAETGRGFDLSYRQVVDIEMWFHLLEKGDLAYTPETLCAFRQHATQQSAVNDQAGVAKPEHALLMLDYAGKPWMPRRVGFTALYCARKLLRQNPELATPELLAAERDLSKRLGEPSYCAYWLRHKLTYPLSNIRRSIGKRRIRWRLAHGSHS